MKPQNIFLVILLGLVIIYSTITATAQQTTNSDCKCSDEQHFLNGTCTNEEKSCFTELTPGIGFQPVCGCDGLTYSNECTASFYGIKNTTKGACLTSSGLIKCNFHSDCQAGICPDGSKFFQFLCDSGFCVKSMASELDCNNITSSSGACSTDKECPKGFCPNGQTYLAYSCLNGQCNQINYFADPCFDISSSPSSGQIRLNKNFNGIWKARLTKPAKTSSSSTSGSNDCVICAQLFPVCNSDEVLIPQNCNECANCSEKSNSVKSPEPPQPLKPTLFHIDDGFKGSRILTLNLCVKDGLLDGTITQNGVVENSQIIFQDLISANEVSILIEQGSKIILKLTGSRALSGTFSDGHTFEARKTSSLKRCSRSTSGGTSPCSPKGNCRGKNGKELNCPNGTFCSGLPAYGCYPPNCPVPVCCSYGTRIKTTGEEKNIAAIKKGDLVISDENKPVKVIKTSKVEVKDHNVLKIKLNDATILEISPNHPIGDGRLFKDLMIGDKIDSRMVVETNLIPYKYKYTYDILPDSKSGNYYANGVFIGSTLK